MESFILADNQDITRAGLEYYVSHLTVGASVSRASNKRELSESFIRQVVMERNIGVLLKECAGDEIVAALRCSLRGERYLCHQIANMLASNSYRRDVPTDLTATELEVLRLIARGKTVKEIAAIRVSSIHTIITHKKNIFRKLEVNNIYEATSPEDDEENQQRGGTVQELPHRANMASAKASMTGRSACFMRERMVTVGPTISIPFICSSMAVITLAAVGAHEPFSMMPTRRF